MTRPSVTASLAHEVYARVRDRLFRGELGLGQVISRRKLAAELGMSFLPVSEALVRLEAEGLLESRPRAGTRVRLPTPDDVRGHFVIREALEAQAAMLCAAAATGSERGELRRLASRVDALAGRGDRALYLGLHLKLHHRIAECTGCAPLCEAIERAHAFAMTWACALPPAAASPARHAMLVDAILSGNRAAAADAARVHVAVAARHAIEALAPYFAARSTHDTYARSESGRRRPRRRPRRRAA